MGVLPSASPFRSPCGAPPRGPPSGHGESEAKFELHLEAFERPREGRLLCRLHYDAQRYSRPAAETLARAFQGLLRAARADPHGAVDQMQLTGAHERRQLLARASTSAVPPIPARAAPPCLHELVARSVRATPDATAVVWGERGALSYANLWAACDPIVRQLSACGVGPDVCVGILIERSADLLVAMLSVLRAGGACVPLDASCDARAAAVLDDAAARAVLVHAATKGAVPAAFAGMVIPIDGKPPVAAGKVLSPSPDSGSGVQHTNLSHVMFTSGSSGRPKGVAIEHHVFAQYLLWACQYGGPCATRRPTCQCDPTMSALTSESRLCPLRRIGG